VKCSSFQSGRPGTGGVPFGRRFTGTVASTHYAPRSRGQPTFLNHGHAYPNEDFTAVIWGENRSQFRTPEDLEGHRICVTGQITLYRGKPEAILDSPLQLKE
jgi:hypothetical protein